MAEDYSTPAMKAALKARLESEKIARQAYTKVVALAKIERDKAIAAAWADFIEATTPGDAKDDKK